MGSLTKSSELSTSEVLWRIRRHREQLAHSIGEEYASTISVPLKVFEELVASWQLLDDSKREGQFPVMYGGPGLHPDHPTVGCAGLCGHQSNCSTHGTPHHLAAPCDCKKAVEDGNVGG